MKKLMLSLFAFFSFLLLTHAATFTVSNQPGASANYSSLDQPVLLEAFNPEILS